LIKSPLFVSIKYKRKINGLDVVGPADEIELAVSDKVLFYSKNWRELKYAGEISVILSKEVLEKLKNGEIVNKPMDIAYPITIYDIKLGYYVENKQKIYYPVWIFYCKDGLGNDLKLVVEAVKR